MIVRCIAIISAVAVAIAIAPAARADIYGAVRGTVDDGSGRAVSGATLTLKPQTGNSLTTHTDDHGAYIFPRVVFDTYTLTVSAGGFEAATDVVTVSSGSVVIDNFSLSKKVIGRIVTRAIGGQGQPNSVNVISTQVIQSLPSNSKLAKIVEITPGIVPFSYDEPVARGYHGVTYEIDGIPMPQSSSSNFAEIVDPRNIDHIEVFTGAMPPEFGGERIGAVVDIITRHGLGVPGQSGALTLYGGNYGTAGMDLQDSVTTGLLNLQISADSFRTSRGIDSPTFAPTHDDSSRASEFLRASLAPNSRDTWTATFSNQYSVFQIPIDTNSSDPLDPAFSVPGTDDHQHEYDRFANILYNRLTGDGKGYFEIGPWYRRSRVTFIPDPANDLLGGAAASTFQDRVGQYSGITAAIFRGGERHNVKVGFTGDIQNFTSAFSITLLDPITLLPLPPFTDNVAQKGAEVGIYAQDKWYVSPVVTLNYGARYDHSTGFTSGNQISPRVELNIQATPQDTVHFYYGRFYAAPALEDVRRDAVVVGGGSGIPVYDLKPESDSVYEFGVGRQFTPLVHGYVTYWTKNVTNVLDTTQIGSTPIFTIFNSAFGRSQGLELNITGRTPHDNTYYLSYGLSQSLAKGISGGTFLFSPDALLGATDWALEDHDQTNTVNAAYTWNFGGTAQRYATIQSLYGSGFPALFENGLGRLPAHLTFNASYGVRPDTAGHRIGWEFQAQNLLNDKYLLKLNNGFNTTQYAAGRQISLKLTLPIR